MNIEDFVMYVNDNAIKKAIFGQDDYTDIAPSYYKKLSIIENNIVRCPKNRLSYEVIWDKNCNQRNIFILFNPSIANSNFLDETLKNCVRISYSIQNTSNKNNKCGGMIIYNTFTIRHPQIENAIKMINFEYEYENNPLFKLATKYPNNISNLIIAWGNDVKTKLNEEYYERLKNLIYQINTNHHVVYAYRINKTGARQPSHPSPRCTKLVKEFCKNPYLIELKEII